MNWIMVAAITGGLVSASAVFVTLWKMIVFFGKMSRLYPVMVKMAEQFRTDSGSSLKDQINRLEKAANDNAESARVSKAASEAQSAAAVMQTALIEKVRAEISRLAQSK